jgi:murein DD-endopeptidase MepM/ murein hydrolase activator NlpD
VPAGALVSSALGVLVATGCEAGGGDRSLDADVLVDALGGQDAAAGASDAASIEEPPARAIVVNTGGVGLNLRAEPSLEGEILAQMPDRTVLVLRGEPRDAFWPVRHGEAEGWAAEGFLEIYLDGDLPELGSGYNFLLPWRDGEAFRVSQGHNQGSHTGISAWAWDFAMPIGTQVVASHSGIVRSLRTTSNGSGCDPIYINEAKYVTVDRGDGLETTYVHLDSVGVVLGQQVERGEVLGTSGDTGYACGAHLHFQVQRSPDGGGGSSGANQSVQAYFWDTGAALDPLPPSEPISRNGSADVP